MAAKGPEGAFQIAGSGGDYSGAYSARFGSTYTVVLTGMDG